MPIYSQKSKLILGTVHPGLIRVANEAIKLVDIKILSGHRGQAEQDRLFRDKLSKKRYPDSKHNRKPSEAFDFVPCPIDWEDRERFVYAAALIIGIGHAYGLRIRWGGDWDMDSDLYDQKFMDLGHVEVLP